MCGFLGWFSPTPSRRSDAFAGRCASALDRIAHRGPDDSSDTDGPGWWMGFRRLSILDLSDAGRQPMSFGDGRYSLTFNGEIYNFSELRHTALHDPLLQSSGDTAVLGSLLARDPVETILPTLRGMFAFAWWDQQKREAFVARDRFGIKPLFYHHAADGALFVSSELRPLLHWLGGSLELCHEALDGFLRTGSVPAPLTLDSRIRCLQPGHLLRWRDGTLTEQSWFTPTWPGPEAWITDPAAQRGAVRETILDSVRAHLVADVPVGVFLSGGLDSSLMAAAMRQLGQEHVQAFSIGFESGSGVSDESDTARDTAAHLGCDFTARKLTSDDLLGELDGYFDHLDQPTGDALNTYLASQLAAQQVKVTLSGLGADEWFAGYNYHRLAALAAASPIAKSSLGGPVGHAVERVLRPLPASIGAHPAAKALLYASGGMGRTPQEWQSRARTLFDPDQIARLTDRKPIPPGISPSMETRAPGSWLHQLLLCETDTYLADTLLRDNDATSMAHSLELRVPLVDPHLFSLAGRLPPGAKLSGSVGKRILRDSFSDLLPPWIADDHRKRTFTLPLMKWMTTPRWRDRILDTLTSTACRDRGWISPQETARITETCFRSSDGTKRSWHLSQSVWVLFVLESWAQRHAG